MIFNSMNWNEILKDPLIRKISLWSFKIGGILLLMFAPMDVLDSSPVLAAITDFMSGIVPSINKWAANSQWPQPTRLFFSYCWLTVPFQIIIIAKHKQSEERFIRVWRGSPKIKYFLRLIIVFLFTGVWFLANFYFALPYTRPSVSPFNPNPYHSKLVQAGYGVIMVFTVAGLTALIIWYIKNFRVIYFNNSTQGDKR